MKLVFRTLVILVLGGMAVSCQDSFSPPPGTYRFQPPPAYAAAWASVEDCSGLRGGMNRVQWYALPGVTTFPCGEGSECSGMWRSPHSVYVAEWARDMYHDNYLVVRHEMLHDLLGGGGADGRPHPSVFWTCGLMRTAQP